MNLQIFVAENFSKIVYMGSVGDLNTCRGIMLGRGLGSVPWFLCRWGSVCRMGYWTCPFCCNCGPGGFVLK